MINRNRLTFTEGIKFNGKGKESLQSWLYKAGGDMLFSQKEVGLLRPRKVSHGNTAMGRAIKYFSLLVEILKSPFCPLVLDSWNIFVCADQFFRCK